MIAGRLRDFLAARAFFVLPPAGGGVNLVCGLGVQHLRPTPGGAGPARRRKLRPARREVS